MCLYIKSHTTTRNIYGYYNVVANARARACLQSRRRRRRRQRVAIIRREGDDNMKLRPYPCVLFLCYLSGILRFSGAAEPLWLGSLCIDARGCPAGQKINVRSNMHTMHMRVYVLCT